MDDRRLVRTILSAVATVALFAATCACVGTAAAHTTADLRAGAYTDANAMAIGGGVVTGLSHSNTWMFNPNLEVVFPDGGNMFSMNADFQYQFPGSGSVGVYAGGGPALLIADPNNGSSQSDGALNLIGGVEGRHGSARPFGQAKAVLSDNSEFVLMGGVRF